MLGDGKDARHVGELDVGLGFEQLLQEHEERALVILGEQGVEEHGVPFVHDEAEARLRGVVDALERREQPGPRLDARLGSERTEVVDEARADGVDVVPIAPTLVGQRAEVDIDDVVGSEVRHGRRVAGYLQTLEQRSCVQAAREEACQHLRVDRLAKAARARDADAVDVASEEGGQGRPKARLVDEAGRPLDVGVSDQRCIAVDVRHRRPP